MKQFLTTHYWFYSRAGSLVDGVQYALVFFIFVLFLFLVISRFVRFKKISPAITKRVRSFLALNGFLGLFLLGFTYEEIPFLSSRFWFLLWFVEMILYAYSIVRFDKKNRLNKQASSKIDEYKKYLP